MWSVRRVVGALLALALSVSVTGPAVAAPPAPQVSLLTFAPGEIYWQRFGHNALLVRKVGATPQVYNYGIFDFRQKNFFLNFARGRMLYRLDAAPLDWTLQQYAAEARWVVEQQLALEPAQARALAEFLAWNALPQNADYRYDYFLSNCSTKARDAIDRALGGGLRSQLEPRPGVGTYRGEVLNLMAPMPALMAAMDLGLGPRVDVQLDQWAEGFIPLRLMHALREVRIDDGDGGSRALVVAERTLVAATAAAPLTSPRLMILFPVSGLVFGAMLWALGRARDRRSGRAAFAVIATLYATLLGLTGVVLLLGWLATDHWGMARNHNLLLMHPFWWLLLPALARHAWQREPRASAFIGWIVLLIAAAAVVALPFALVGPQPNLHWVALLLPPHLAVLSILRGGARSPA